jgi:hypothetical protein
VRPILRLGSQPCATSADVLCPPALAAPASRSLFRTVTSIPQSTTSTSCRHHSRRPPRRPFCLSFMLLLTTGCHASPLNWRTVISTPAELGCAVRAQKRCLAMRCEAERQPSQALGEGESTAASRPLSREAALLRTTDDRATGRHPPLSSRLPSRRRPPSEPLPSSCLPRVLSLPLTSRSPCLPPALAPQPALLPPCVVFSPLSCR